MAEFKCLVVSRDRDVAWVTLNRPDLHNAFDSRLIVELTAAFSTLSRDESVRIIVLRGAGKSFCAGADVNWMRKRLDLSESENIEDALRMSDMFSTIDQAPQATICQVHGAALGGGMGLVAVCDIVVAAEDSRFGFTEARLGIIPAVISNFVVPKIGVSWTRRLFLTAERFDAARAREIGLIHDVSPAGALEDAVRTVIKDLRASGPRAVQEAKLLIAGLVGLSPAERRTFTAQRIASVRTGLEGQEGLRAFLDKRPPSWAREEES